jgi:predicted nucleic acid-binding Zn ribbon protein
MVMKKYITQKGKDSLAASLPGLIRDKGWEKQFDLYFLFLEWDKIVDRATAQHARPLKIVRNVFWVEVDNSSWLQQLQFQKVQILEDLNAALEGSLLKGIKFVLAEKSEGHPQEQQKKITFTSVDPVELKAFENQVSIIGDEKSREALVRFWYLSKACRRG